MLSAPIRGTNKGKDNILRLVSDIFVANNSHYMRIAGVTIPDKKPLEVALTSIFGVGRSRAKKILKNVGIDPNARSSGITSSQENAIRKEIELFSIEGDLKRLVSSNIKRLKDIKSYRGTRHTKHLPLRGQKTRTNSRTVRGNVRHTMGSGKRKLEKT